MTSQFVWFAILMAANGLLLFLLTANVSRLRIKYQVSLGDGDNKSLAKAIRAHANGVEQLPVFALLVLALCLLSFSPFTLAALVIAFTVARVLHAIGMLTKAFAARRIGAALTYLLQLGAAICVILALLGVAVN